MRRKPVTALFCDLVISTATAERLGPDGMHALLSRFFELAQAEVHRYEGTLKRSCCSARAMEGSPPMQMARALARLSPRDG